MSKHYIFIIFFTTLSLLLSVSCSKPTVSSKNTKNSKQAFGKEVMVVTAHPAATKVGLDILKKGGNATDAGIAVQMALAVVYPRAGNIGGGGFWVYRENNGETAALDFREKAPKAAHKDMYLDEKGNVIEGLSTQSHLSVGVPGVVDGMVKVHEKYGSLPWETLIAPAQQLAEVGFPLTAAEAHLLNVSQDFFNTMNTQPHVFMGKFETGDTIRQPELAATLLRIQKEKEAGFYQGKTAQLLLEEMKRGKGIITQEDLDEYEAVWRTPFEEPYKEYTIISMPPPSSGGVALCQLLNAVEPYPLSEMGFHSVEHIHLVTEAERRVYADRATHLGDPDFWDVPVQELIDETYLAERMSNFNPQQATASHEITAGVPIPKESEETTHFCIVDKAGNAVSVTTTLNLNYGSGIVVGGAGFFLNNEMDDFSAKPGHPNAFGLVGNEGNAIAPEKRMLSSMTPSIFLKNDSLYMVVGTPGGSTIITSVFQTFVNVVEFGMPLKAAVHRKRFHSQWLPDKIFIEKNALDSNTIQQLQKMGHTITERESIGRVEAILVHPDGQLEGVADIRGDDTAAGF